MRSKRDTCDKCKATDIKQKHLHKVNGSWLCKKCYREHRINHRQETIEKTGIKDELRLLKNKEKREYEKERRSKLKKFKPKKFIQKENPLPKIKGSKRNQKFENNNLFLTLEEKRNLFRILKRRGIDEDEVKERIKNLTESLQNLRKKLRENKISKEELSKKKMEMLEELWNH